jgi:exodeoxyribonuclease VII small subunit
MQNLEQSETKPYPSFEEALASLESIIQSIEDGNTPLAELMNAYEKGTEYLKICQTHLQEAELKLLKINNTDAAPTLFNLDADT